MSLLDPDDDMPGTGLGGLLFGDGGKDVSKAALAQTQFSQQALDLLRSNLSPFVESGVTATQSMQAMANPAMQAMFLASNPLFATMSDQTVRDITARQAAKGKLGSGETAEGVQSALINLGNQLINQQFQRAMPLAELGQASAARQGAGSVDLLTGMGNAQAAGAIGQANIQAGQTQNLVQLASMLGGAFGGGSNSSGPTYGGSGSGFGGASNTVQDYSGFS